MDRYIDGKIVRIEVAIDFVNFIVIPKQADNFNKYQSQVEGGRERKKGRKGGGIETVRGGMAVCKTCVRGLRREVRGWGGRGGG